MKEAIYHKMAEVEGSHWWFAGRRRIVADVLARLGLPAQARILEVGCGSGGNFALLSRYGSLYATDSDENALAYARQAGRAIVEPGRLPADIPFADQSFDLILLLDVLEHVEEDEQSLRFLHERLAPGGRLLVTVPAYRCLWSAHDDFHQHKRRYTRGELQRKSLAAGFRVRKLSYFNTCLFPVVAVFRLLERLFPGRAEKDLDIPPSLLNRVLTAIFSGERFLLRGLNLPFGVSLILVGEKHV